MRIAIPTLNEEYSPHMGKSDALFVCDFDPQTRQVSKRRHVPRKEQSLTNMLIELAVEMVLAGGMNHNTMQNLESNGIDCCLGMTGQTPLDVLLGYINKPDQARENICPGIKDSSYECEYEC